MATVQEKLLERVFEEEGTLTVRKVTIVGVGQVGMACAYTLFRSRAENCTVMHPFFPRLSGAIIGLAVNKTLCYIINEVTRDYIH